MAYEDSILALTRTGQAARSGSPLAPPEMENLRNNNIIRVTQQQTNPRAKNETAEILRHFKFPGQKLLKN